MNPFGRDVAEDIHADLHHPQQRVPKERISPLSESEGRYEVGGSRVLAADSWPGVTGRAPKSRHWRNASPQPMAAVSRPAASAKNAGGPNALTTPPASNAERGKTPKLASISSPASRPSTSGRAQRWKAVAITMFPKPLPSPKPARATPSATAPPR